MTISIIAGGSTSLLFVIRVCAVYEQSKAVKLFFGIFWLAIPVASALVAINGHSSVSFPKPVSIMQYSNILRKACGIDHVSYP